MPNTKRPSVSTVKSAVVLPPTKPFIWPSVPVPKADKVRSPLPSRPNSASEPLLVHLILLLSKVEPVMCNALKEYLR